MDERTPGKPGTTEYLLMIWCVRRVYLRKLNSNSQEAKLLSPVDILWLIIAELVVTRADSDVRRIAVLAFECEKLLMDICKLERNLLLFQVRIPNSNNDEFVTDLKQLVAEIPNLIRAHLVGQLKKTANEWEVMDFEKTILEHLRSLQWFKWDWDNLSASLK
jgi:hypothetical protein